jgi:ParB-like chromosome segregation protein Spo0J
MEDHPSLKWRREMAELQEQRNAERGLLEEVRELSRSIIQCRREIAAGVQQVRQEVMDAMSVSREHAPRIIELDDEINLLRARLAKSETRFEDLKTTVDSRPS